MFARKCFLKTDDQLNIRDFNTYNYIYSEGQRPSDGSSILVHSSYPRREIKLVTNLQAVAVSVTLGKEITICSVCIRPNFHLETEHLDTLLKQLPSSYILVDDFSGQNILWRCKDNNPKGNIIEDFISKNDLYLMNDKSHTYLHLATGKFSSLDLSICHPSLLLDFDWTVSEDQHGSDHFTVIIESVNNSTNDHNAKWKLNKANWELNHSLCEEQFLGSSRWFYFFSSQHLSPKTSTNPKKSKPSYNDDCKDAIKQRKQALSKFCRYPLKENLNSLEFQSKGWSNNKASKRKSWKSYVSNLNHKIPIKKVWDMTRKISGKTESPSFTHLNTKRGAKATSKEKIANTLGDTFLDNSPSRNYSEKFQNIIKQKEKIKLNFTSSNTEE